jgi:hypothetical protein
VERDTRPSAALAEQCDLRRVAAEGVNRSLHPAQSSALILHTIVPRRVRRVARAKGVVRCEAHNTEAHVQRHQDHRMRRAVAKRQQRLVVVRRSEPKLARVQVHHHREERAGRGARGRVDVQREAVFRRILQVERLPRRVPVRV